MRNNYFFLPFLFLSFPGRALSQQFTIETGRTVNSPVPVIVDGVKGLKPGSSYALTGGPGKKKIPVQLMEDGSIIFIIDESIPAGMKHSYSIESAKKSDSGPIKISKQQNGLLVTHKDNPILFYRTATAMPPADSPAYYQRSGFVHPLWSPSGDTLTDDFPAGHTHQHALFAAWTSTRFRNTMIDFWNQHQQKGTVEHVEVQKIERGPVCGRFQVLLRYRSLQYGEVLLEKWIVTIYPFSQYYLFDISLEQTNTTNDTLYLEKYHYGGMAFRGSKYWNPFDKKNFGSSWNVLTNEGIRDSMANHTHAKWVDVSGKMRIGNSGVTVFDHSSNFRYPQAIRVHPTMPYWSYAPIVDGEFYIPPGGKYRATYRYYVHEGMPNISIISQLESDYSHPPVINIQQKN